MKVLITSYNDADTIGRTLESVKHLDVHLFDGKFVDFPGDSLASTDGTLEIAKGFSNVTVYDAVPNETQCEKRTRMFSVLTPGEYGLKLDGDEILLGEINGIQSHDVYWGWTISPLYDYPYCTARIFRMQEGMHYAGRHHFLFDKKKKLIASDQNMGLNYQHATLDFRIFNIRHRNKKRDQDKMKFLLSRGEQTVRSEHQVYGRQQIKSHPDRAQAVRAPMDELTFIKPTKITFGLTFSRPWAVQRYFYNFDQLLLPECEMVCVVDTNDKKFYKQVQAELQQRKDRFTGIKTFMTGNPPPLEKKRVHERRLRIAKSLHIILTEAQGDILLGGEDDSLPQPDAYLRLIAHLDKADFAQATIVGRWEPTIPAWHVQELNGTLFKIWTGEKKNGTEEIQGMGWYCFAAKTNLLRQQKIHWDYCKHIGPDWHMGYDLFRTGHKLLHDHDVHVTHFGENFELTLNAPTIVKRWIKQGNLWRAY